MKNIKFMGLLAGLILFMASFNSNAADKETIATGKELLKKFSNAVVNISATVTMTAEGEMAAMIPAQDQKTKIAGTIIDKSGLAVCSLMALDPVSAIGKINIMGKSVSLKSEMGDVKFRLADGTEVEAKLVLRDDDLDLAFIAPKAPLSEENQAKIAAIDLNDSAAAEILDETIAIGRFGKMMNYQPSVDVTYIKAVINKPRKFYVGAVTMGTPVFNAKGKLIGLSVARRSGKSASASRAGKLAVQQIAIILPAEDIKEIAEQAKAAVK